MALALGYRISILFVLAALLGTSGLLVLARPEYHPRYESKMIDFSKQHYMSPRLVRQTFAAHGIRLYKGADAWSVAVFSGSPKFTADALSVNVGPRTGTGSFGPKLEPYDERFGNVLVTYGGHDKQFLERIKAALTDLH